MHAKKSRTGRLIIAGLLVAALLCTTASTVVLAIRARSSRRELAQLKEQLVENDRFLSQKPDGEPGDAQPDEPKTDETDNGETQPPAFPLPPDAPEYQALYPELYAAEGPRSALNPEKTIYLTFDDGPSKNTPAILKTLQEQGVKATFFVVGKADEQSRQWMRDIVAAGHTIAIHTYSHQYKSIYASVDAYLDDFAKIYQLVYDATGVYPQIFRFPGGSVNSYNKGIYQEIIAEMLRRGFVYFDWNVSAEDAVSKADSATIANNILKSASKLRRGFVLMHDSADKAATAQALPAVIAGYKKQGFSFEPLSPKVVPVVFAYSD